MCANFLPARPEKLRPFGLPDPGFAFGECYPGKIAPILANDAPDLWRPAAFGMVPHWGKPELVRMTYNARSETVGEKPSFRNAWRHRQFCILPVEAFFEPNYESGKAVRWQIRRKDFQAFGLACIWEHRQEDQGPLRWTFSMLTINADNHPLMKRFHKPQDEKRSVVILPANQWQSWLAAKDEGAAVKLLGEFDPVEYEAMESPRR